VIRRAGCCSREGPSRAAGTGTSVEELPRLGENGIGGLGPDEGFGAGIVFITVGSVAGPPRPPTAARPFWREGRYGGGIRR
jgi:hypothetical protein